LLGLGNDLLGGCDAVLSSRANLGTVMFGNHKDLGTVDSTRGVNLLLSRGRGNEALLGLHHF
jgi:hypothetical protein